MILTYSRIGYVRGPTNSSIGSESEVEMVCVMLNRGKYVDRASLEVGPFLRENNITRAALYRTMDLISSPEKVVGPDQRSQIW